MKTKIVFEEDYLNLGDLRKEKAENIVSYYLKKIESREQFYDNPLDVLFVIAEAYPLLNEQDKWLEKTYELVSRISQEILTGKYEYQPGLIIGLCKIGFIIRLLNKKCNHYKKFSNTLDEYIIRRMEVIVELYEKHIGSLKTQHYDVIYGLSGAGIYLLECESSRERDKVLRNILVYLSKLILDSHEYQTMEIPNWHILNENHLMDYDRKYYSFGSFNFGVSHGIIGIYSFASHMYRRDMEKNLAKRIIDKIESLYMKYSKVIDNCRYWPGRLKLEEFVREEYIHTNYRQSWCYGSIGVNAVFLKEAYLSHDIDLQKIMYNNMLEIAKIPLENYELNSPIICHGYAGVLEIFINAQKICKNSVLHKKICELFDIIVNMYDQNSTYGYIDVSMRMNENGEFQTILKDNNSFLEGASGIILVLLSSYISNTEFQKILLL